ncbi:MAG: hypothetical protein GX628_01760 [Clostridiales bacterium]|nr:hypothetical protein [Clostridiales bacterium]
MSVDYILQNEYLRVSVNGNAALTSLCNLKGDGKNVIDAPADEGFFACLAFRETERFENFICGSRQSWKIVQEGNTITFSADRLIYSDGLSDDCVADVSLILKIELRGEDLLFTADVDNRTDAYFTDFEFPRVGEIRTLGDGIPTLFVPDASGMAITNPGEIVSYGQSRESHNNVMDFLYPGPISMQWLALCGKENCFFFVGNDSTFSAVNFRVEGRYNGSGAMTFIYDRFACVNPNSKISFDPLKLKLYSGDWRHGVAEYSKWIAPYRPKHERPEWVKDTQGYFLVINKQQYGYDMWPYDTLPKLYELAEAHGYDTLGLFGWYESGHDNRYPDLEVSETLGGEDKLKAGIKAVQEMGGHVTLYYQGHLIDSNSDFYKNGGNAYTLKTIWGNEYIEYYNKSHRSSYLRNFSHKRFALACPSCPEWVDLMTEREDWLASFGADGCLYDQIGGIRPYVCFDENHKHDGDSPARAVSGGRQRLMGSLQRHSKEIAPEFAFFTENITDLYSTYADMLHSVGVYPNGKGVETAAAEHPERVIRYRVPELFRTAFPEVKITVRNPTPNTNERFTNLAFLHSFIFEQEIRYRADKDDILADKFAPQREYTKKVSDLRRRCWDIIGRGVYVDRKYVNPVNPSFMAVSYETDDKVAVTVWNDCTKAQPLSVLGIDSSLKFKGYHTIDGEFEALPETVPADGIAVITYTK